MKHNTCTHPVNSTSRAACRQFHALIKQAERQGLVVRHETETHGVDWVKQVTIMKANAHYYDSSLLLTLGYSLKIVKMSALGPSENIKLKSAPIWITVLADF